MNYKDIEKEWKKKCHLTKGGKCKYWKVEAFGYSPNDYEAPLDKFFPQEVLEWWLPKINQVIDEMIDRGDWKVVKGERKSHIDFKEGYNQKVSELKEYKEKFNLK